MESRGEISIKVGFIWPVIGGNNMESRGEISIKVGYIYRVIGG